MKRPDHETTEKSGLSRRGLLLSGLAVCLLGVGSHSADAQRFRHRRRMRGVRRRALRRLRRRDRGLPDRARQAVRRGEIRPFRDVLALVERRSNGEVLDVDLHQRGDRWIYALRVLRPNGRVNDVFVDARTLEVVNSRALGGGDGVPLPRDLPGPPPPHHRPPPPGPPGPPPLRAPGPPPRPPVPPTGPTTTTLITL